MNTINSLADTKISLSYFGAFNDEITKNLISISAFFLEHKSDIGKLKNKVSFLIAECFQNIVRHTHTHKTQINNGDFFQLNVLSDRIVLVSCNFIEEKYIPDLEKKLTKVNALNANELKKVYTDLLKNGEFSEKGGAGLGLIEMARKSGLPIKFKFKNMPNGSYKFFLLLEIIQTSTAKEKVHLQQIETIYEDLYIQNVLIQYKGDFSIEIINPILDMIKHNFSKNKDANYVTEKRVIIALVETLENITKHAKLIDGIKQGLLTISKIESRYFLETGNYVDIYNYEKLNYALNYLKSLNTTQLNNCYKNNLMQNNVQDNSNIGLGLIEMARKSGNNFSFNFVKSNNSDYFYTLKITV